jgi:hypothetical protein
MAQSTCNTCMMVTIDIRQEELKVDPDTREAKLLYRITCATCGKVKESWERSPYKNS